MLLQLFFSFFKIGSFTFGGGYAMLPVIQREVVENRRWVEEKEFLEVLGVSQSGPGAVAVNTAIYLGYKIKGVPGSIAATLGVVTPSFLIILALATILQFVVYHPVGEGFFAGIRPAVVGLLISVTINMFNKLEGIHSWFLFFLSALFLIIFSIHPALIILLSALYGGIFFSKDIIKVRGE
ncbi:chromate transporter [Anaerobranca californiensis DSM 14826]|uniref:Chromate transporter n=1 Tax=Anaerobranca californiensis DSM 14826 TaxID=1120989 RepID=A0A1M6LNN9_9FIRM|nr:chromate transporter [Anaerobranca californiensis]SHJ72821.1 chromate transporter [Anaerobranca californiensis DSM 14826]